MKTSRFQDMKWLSATEILHHQHLLLVILPSHWLHYTWSGIPQMLSCAVRWWRLCWWSPLEQRMPSVDWSWVALHSEDHAVEGTGQSGGLQVSVSHIICSLRLKHALEYHSHMNVSYLIFHFKALVLASALHPQNCLNIISKCWN